MSVIPAQGEQLLDRYVLEELVSTTGMTAVFRCTDTRLEVNGAIKLLLTGDEGQDAERTRCFLEAARCQAKLNHPNIVHVTNIESRQGVTFSVLEWLCGMTLSDHFSLLGETLTAKEIVGVFISLADALSVAHAGGVLHRIFNPTNIFLNQLGTRLSPCLLNFGTSRTSQGLDPAVQLPFVAPEQLDDFMCADERSDIFSVCATFAYAFMHQPLVQFQTIDQYVNFYRSAGEIPIPSAIPADFVPLLRRGLCVDPQGRFSSAVELLRSLREIGSSYSLSANLTLEAPKSYTSGSFRPVLTPTGGVMRSVSVEPAKSGLVSNPAIAPQPEFRRTNSNPLVTVPAVIPPALEKVYSLVQPISHTDEKSVLLVRKTDDTDVACYVLKVLNHPSPSQAQAFRTALENMETVTMITPHVQNIVASHPDCCAFLTSNNERESLTRLIAENGPINEQYTLQVAILLAQALVSMHEAGIIHGNIKPNNIFFEKRDSVSFPVLFDLGQSLYIERPQEVSFDQMPFIAPETGFNLRNANPQTDIFAFGMLLNTMLLGSSVYTSTRRPSLYREITGLTTAPSLLRLAPGVNQEFVRIIDWCTSFDPNGRYRTFNDVLRDLYIIHPAVMG